MDRHVLAENVVVADLGARLFVLVAEVLRSVAEDRADADVVPLAQRQRSEQARMRSNDAIRTDANGAFDNDIRPDLDVLADVGLRIDNRGGMDASSSCDWHGIPFRRSAKNCVLF